MRVEEKKREREREKGFCYERADHFPFHKWNRSPNDRTIKLPFAGEGEEVGRKLHAYLAIWWYTLVPIQDSCISMRLEHSD